MKLFPFHIGVDVSKLSLDFCLMDSGANVVLQGKTKNTPEGITFILKKMDALNVKRTDAFFCFENTGVYSLPLSLFLSEESIAYAEIPALEIKKSKGLTRGKTDKTDARDIALYSIRHADKIHPSRVADKAILQLKAVLSEREKTVEAIKSFSMTKEYVDFAGSSTLNHLAPANQAMVLQLKAYRRELDQLLERIMESNEELNRQKQLLMSIPGIGKTIAVYLIVITKGFSSFSNSRQLACYAGVAPFEYSSGTSIKGKTRVSSFANKKLKSLLHMAALNAVRCDGELKSYYQRKKGEGKHSMLVINNVKCKLVGRVFAVINRSTPFVNTFKFAA